MDTERLKLTLLGGQAFFFGVYSSLLYVVANTLFLAEFGVDNLPYVYIAIGLFVPLYYYTYAELQKRWVLSRLSVMTVSMFAGVLLLAWVAFGLPIARAGAFGLMIFFVLQVQGILIVLGGQAGQLFTVRQMKRLFPLIVSAVIVGIIIAGLSVPTLLDRLNGIEDLLLVAVAAMLMVLGLLLVTTKKFSAQLDQVESSMARRQPAQSTSQLLRKRYVALILLYQFLSAIGSQLVIYIFMVQAEARFPDPNDLADFFGKFIGVRNIIALLFLMLVAGYLIGRFGLRLGLTLNPIAVGLMLLVLAISAVLSEPISPLVFWLALGTYVLDIILTDGITSTSIKATYQALPAADRSRVETTVEGIGVPVALGTTGVMLLGLNAVTGLTLTHIIIFSMGVTVFWTAAGILVYRNYGGALRRSLSRRALGKADLTLENSSSLAVVETLLHGSKPREIRLGLDILVDAEHESLDAHLINLIAHPNHEIRTEAMNRLERHPVETALPAVEQCLRIESNPAVKGAALRAMCALKESDAVESVALFLDDPETDVQLGAMVGLLRYGGIPGVLAAGQRLQNLEHNPNPAYRQLVGKVIGQVEMDNFYQPLMPLLLDDDENVRQAALQAARLVNHPRLLPAIIGNLPYRQLRSAAMAALVASGEAVLPLVAKALAGESDYDEETVIRLVRVCSDIKGDKVIETLKPHLNHPDDDVQYQVLVSLDRCGYRAVGADAAAEIESTLRGEVEHGMRVMFTKQDIGEQNHLTDLHRALDYEFEQARRRVFLLLSFIFDSRAILRAEEQLIHGSKGEQALALETLDVTLSGEQKAMVFPLVDQSKPLDERMQQLAKLFSLQHKPRDQRLLEIISDPEGVWTHGWTQACAIYGAAQLRVAGAMPVIEAALAITEHPIPETAAWALDFLQS